jgi:hypothetical protein
MLATASGLFFIAILIIYLAHLSVWSTESSSLELFCAWNHWKKVIVIFKNSGIRDCPAAQDVPFPQNCDFNLTEYLGLSPYI